jgi:hypothetical protein
MHTNPLLLGAASICSSPPSRGVFNAWATVRPPSFAWTDGWMAIREIAPDHFALIPKRAWMWHTMREAPVERRWVDDIQGTTSSLALWQYVQLWIKVRDVQLLSILDTLWQWTRDTQYSSKFLFQGPSYRDLGNLTGAPRLPHESSSTSGLLESLLDRWEVGTAGSRTPRTAHSATNRMRPCNTCWQAAPSPGRCGTKCCLG